MAPVKKPRPAFSCLTCRTRKVRCGREQPECANCRRMNKVCKYQSTSKVSDNQSRQDQSHTDRSTVSRLDVVSRLPSRVRPVDDSLLGLAPFRKKATVDPVPPHINFLAIASVLERIPDKHACDGFVQAFITSVYPLYPLIDLPDFQSWYAVFWQWCHEAGDRRSTIIPSALLEDVTMNCVLFAVLYAGAAASAPTSQESATTKNLESAVSTTLTACDHLRHPTVNTVAASLIIDPFMSKDLGSLEYGLWVSSTVRLAQSIGLHRQEHATPGIDIDLGSVPKASLEPRIWAHTVWLDVQHSLLTGLPLAVTATAGSRFGSLPTPMAGVGPGDTLAGDTAILFQTRTEMARIQHRFIDTVHNASTSTGLISEEIYQGFVSDARTTRDAMESAAGTTTNSEVDSWAQRLATLVHLHMAIQIHIPFLRLPLRPTPSSDPDIGVDQDQDQLWNRIIRLCIRYLRIYVSIISSPAFAPHLWFFARCAEPIQCASLLVSYLWHWPGSTGAYSGMSRNCLGDVFAHWELQQQRHGIQMMDGQKQLKVVYEGLEHRQPQTQPGDMRTRSENGRCTTRDGGEGSFELHTEFLDEVFDWSGREIHAIREATGMR